MEARCFEVHAAKKSFIVCAPSVEMKARWVEALSRTTAATRGQLYTRDAPLQETAPIGERRRSLFRKKKKGSSSGGGPQQQQTAALVAAAGSSAYSIAVPVLVGRCTGTDTGTSTVVLVQLYSRYR